MNNLKHILSLTTLTFFVILAIGSDDSASSPSSVLDDDSSVWENEEPSSSSSNSYYNDYDEKVCQDAYGQWHSHISRCSTCGISYCVEYLPYGEYCSQNCCAAYEGLSSKCGYGY